MLIENTDDDGDDVVEELSGFLFGLATSRATQMALPSVFHWWYIAQQAVPYLPPLIAFYEMQIAEECSGFNLQPRSSRGWQYFTWG